MEKSPTFFGKTPTFFKKSPTFFLKRRRYCLRDARCEGCESKKCKIPGKARASHAREEKPQWRGAKWNKSYLPFHPKKFVSYTLKLSQHLMTKDRKGIHKLQDMNTQICKVNKAISPTHKEKTALFRRFLSLCLIWHPYSIEGDEIENSRKSAGRKRKRN